MRVRVLFATVCLAFLLKGLLLAPGPAPAPQSKASTPATEQLWVSATTTVSERTPAPTTSTSTASTDTSAPAPVVSEPLAAPDESAAAFGGCRGCVGDFGRPRPKAPIPGVPKRTGCCYSTPPFFWAKRHQSRDGHWGVVPEPSCTCCAGPGHERGDDRRDVERTALLLLVHTGNGQTHRYGAAKRSVHRAQGWLRKQQDPQGWIGPRLDFQTAARNHAIATLALAELYWVTRDPSLKQVATRAVTVCARDVASRATELPIATRGWLLLALKVGSLAKLLDHDHQAKRRLVKLTSLDDRDPLGLAVAVLSRVFTGTTLDDPALVAAGRRLATRLPAWKPGRVDLEAWFFATYATFQTGGADWETWRQALLKAVIPSQREGGCADGSWDPIGRQGARGRAWTYAMACLTLEINWRYERAKQSD